MAQTQSEKFYIKSDLNDMVLDVYYGNPNAGTKVTTYYKSDTNDNQLWYVDVATSTIRGVGSKRCLTINNQNRLIIDDYNAANAKQNWEICGKFIRQRSEPATVLNVLDANKSAGASITSLTFENRSEQLWTIENKENPSSAEGRRAPSVTLRLKDNNTQGDILMIDGMVPNHGLAKYTYYSMLQWNPGQEGGGYLGIQDHPDGKNFIFSIWDSKSSHEAIEASYKATGTDIESFGGEGTGLKSWNFTLGWETDQWQTFVTRCWHLGEKTYFGFWVRQPNLNKWSHLITMKYPIDTILFYGNSTASFVEDWFGNGENYRTASYKNHFKRSAATKEWVPIRQFDFTATLEAATSQHNTEYSGGVESPGQLYLATGGYTNPDAGLNSSGTRFNTEGGTTPDVPVINFSITSAGNNTISWSVPESSTPQFAYTITDKATGEVVSATNPEKRSTVMNLTAGSSVVLALEDILGRTSIHYGAISN